MKASKITLKKFIKGALDIREEGAYLCPLRYEKGQLDIIKEADPGWIWRAQFSSTTRIEFMTDATKISLDYYATEFSSSDNTFDLYVNSKLQSVWRVRKFNFDRVTYDLAPGWKLVQIYLPVDCHIAIKNLNFNGGYRTVKDKGQKLLIIGDSITQGYGPFMSGASYVNSLQRKTGYNIIAQGIGGLPFKDCALYKGEYEPDKIMVFLGTNYYECDSYDYENEAINFFKKLNQLWGDKQIIYVSPLWRDNDVIWDRFIWCTKIAKREASKYENITTIDGFDLVPNVNECFVDKIHPNAYGAELLATNLANIFKDLKF